MGNSQSKQYNEYDGFIIISEDEITSTENCLLANLVVHSKTALSKTAGFIGTSLVRLGELTSSASNFVGNLLVVKQGFKTDDTPAPVSQSILRFDRIKFFIIEEKILCFESGNRVCRVGFKLDITKIEMFRLTEHIGFFLFHTRDGNTVATVFSNQNSVRELILTQIADDKSQFERFEAEVCMYGTVSLTVFYKNGTEKYFRIERNGSFTEVVLP